MRRITCFALFALLILGACADADPAALPAGAVNAALAGASGPVVMTRNVYLGADLDPLLRAANPQEVPGLAAAAWAQIQANDFRRRAGVLAAEIAAARPHLVGLQELATFRLQSPADFTSPATLIVQDYLALLLDSLAARGADYRVVARQDGNDIEVPVFTGTGLDEVRFTQTDAIIARTDVSISASDGGVYAARLPLAIGSVPVELVRAWASADATVGAHSFRFVSTHLEVQAFEPIQLLQAAELRGMLDQSELPVVVVGDFNSTADGLQTPTYDDMRAAGFRDVWQPRGADGLTCCHAKDLSNSVGALDQRIDYVFMRGFSDSRGVGARVQVVGAEQRPEQGWGSDHAGVVAALRLPPGLLVTDR